MKTAIISILLLISVLAFAGKDTCPEKKIYPDVDLRSEFPPQRDQGNSNMCFVYVSSDIVNYWLKKHRGIDTSQKENQVSAEALGLQGDTLWEDFLKKLDQKPEMSKLKRQGITKQFFNGLTGTPKDMIDTILEDGYCTESELPTLENGESFKLSRAIFKWSLQAKEASLCQAQAAASLLFPERNFNDIKDVLTQATNEGHLIVTELLEKSCHKKKIPAPLPETKFFKEFDKNEANRELRNKNPIALSINAHILYDDEKSLLKPGKSFSVNHIVSLVGQKFNCETKEMDYILRNTWTCEQRKNGVRCDGGEYIISESVLKKTPAEMTFLSGN